VADPGRRRVAAIDCGTNSLRLLIADVDPARGELSDVHRRMEIVRLGQGVDATGRLAPEAMARTFGVLREYRRLIEESGAQAVRLVATSATRDASNAADFARGVREILGQDPEVIDGMQEAGLSFAGATAELAAGAGERAGRGGRPAEPPFLVTDIGGGSTEFVHGPAGFAAGGGLAGIIGGAAGDGRGRGQAGGRLSAISVDIGCVRLTERHFRTDPPARDQIAAATADIDAALAVVAGALPVTSARTLVGLAGSVTTVTALALGLPRYDPARVHHARITARRVHEVTTALLAESHAERAGRGAIHPGRVDVIGAGALILDRIMSRFGFAEMVASEHDILDGIAWSLAPGAGTSRRP